MKKREYVWLYLGVIATIMFILRATVGLTEEDTAKFISLQPLMELIIIILCLLTIVPNLLMKIKNQTIHDVCFWGCIFVACGIAVFLLPGFIPEDATKDDTDSMTEIFLYALTGAVMVCYLGWESYKAKKRKKLNDQRKAEQDAVHDRAMKESENE